MRIESKQVSHVWAQQSRDSSDHAEGSAHISFTGEFLYSYSEPIGRIYQGCALLRDQTWSRTTSKHQGWMRSAVSHLKSFNVADLGNEDHAPSHKKNIANYRERIERLAAKGAKRLHPTTAEKIGEISAEGNAYAEFFGLKTRFDTSDIHSILAVARKRTAKEESKQRRKDAARLAEAKLNLSLWLDGKDCDSFTLPTAYARIEADELVTTLGARVPLSHAKRAAKLIRKIVAGGTAWTRNGEQIHVGHFRVDSVAVDGTVKAGCHTFEPSEVNRLLQLLV